MRLGPVQMRRLELGTLAAALIDLAVALEPFNGPEHSAAVWRVGPDVLLLHAAESAPRELLASARDRLRDGERDFDLHGELGTRGRVHTCSVGDETVAYGLFVLGAGHPHVETTVQQLLDMAEVTMGKQVNDMSRTEKQQVVRFLDERGAFLIRKAVEDVADRLGVTRFTIYNYLDRNGR